MDNGTVNRTSDTTAAIGFTTTEVGTAFYTVTDSGVTAPTKETVAAGTSLGAVARGAVTKDITLTPGGKDIYVVVKDGIGNISDH
ncbi:MAG: hypothetical protein GX235_05535 [Clostridiales bacterium]|nr:hypothetical protein [Clostridiales bacterium]